MLDLLGSEMLNQLQQTLAKSVSFIQAEPNRETRISMVDAEDDTLMGATNRMAHNQIPSS